VVGPCSLKIVCCTVGAKDGPLKVNVLHGFERAYASDRSDIIWLPEHVEAFLSAASPEMQLAMVLALHSGQRQGDILRFAWAQYDGTGISLRQGKAKRLGRVGRSIRVPCTKALKATLDIAPRRAAVILATKTGLAFKKRYFASQWEATCKAAGITDLHFHDIRGTTVTMLFQAGCHLGEIVSITGHTLRRAPEILDKYLARTSKRAKGTQCRCSPRYSIHDDLARRSDAAGLQTRSSVPARPSELDREAARSRLNCETHYCSQVLAA
jgi:integrase